MKLNHSFRKLLQEEPYPLHPMVPPINDSSTPTAEAVELRRPNFHPNPNPFDTSMALTILVLLTALFFMSFFSFYIRRYAAHDHSDSTTTNHHPPRRPPSSTLYSIPSSSSSANKGLDGAAIKSLPTFPYGGAAKYRIDCSICLSDFEYGETVKLIPYCGHAFHPPCIDTWLSSHVSCPVCRSTQLFAVGGRSVGDDSSEQSDGDDSSEQSDGDDSWRVEVGPGVRRTCSYSSLQVRTALPRNNSF